MLGKEMYVGLARFGFLLWFLNGLYIMTDYSNLTEFLIPLPIFNVMIPGVLLMFMFFDPPKK